jgi:adenylyltransferase/sulfurtransferase
MTHFSEQQLERYQRHLQLPAFGSQGQERCRQAHVAIVGMGGLGCPVSLYLAAAGVGTLTLIDADEVSLSNLQRQVLFTEADIGTNKAVAAAQHLRARNSDIKIHAQCVKLTPENGQELLAQADLVIDCSDNFYARYLINDICHQANKAWIYSSVLGLQGQVALFQPQHSCFRCLFPKLDSVPDCNQAGVLGVMPGMLGTMQASLALQYLAAVELPSSNELHMVDSWPFNMRSIRLSQAPNCALCQHQASTSELARDYQNNQGQLDAPYKLGAKDLAEIIGQQGAVLVDVRGREEHQQGNIGGLNIPLSHLDDLFAPQSGQVYVFYCQTGMRSIHAVQCILEKYSANMDFQIYSLEGGVSAIAT